MKKELIKVGLLLVVGVILLIVLLTKAVQFGKIELNLKNFLIMLVALLYPLGMVYGWRQVIGIFVGIRSGDRADQFTRSGIMTGNITIWNLAVACTIAICFGWIFGVINAVKKLNQLR